MMLVTSLTVVFGRKTSTWKVKNPFCAPSAR